MQKNPSAKVCFTQVELIDENRKTLTNRNRNYSVFITADRKTGRMDPLFFLLCGQFTASDTFI